MKRLSPTRRWNWFRAVERALRPALMIVLSPLLIAVGLAVFATRFVRNLWSGNSSPTSASHMALRSGGDASVKVSRDSKPPVGRQRAHGPAVARQTRKARVVGYRKIVTGRLVATSGRARAELSGAGGPAAKSGSGRRLKVASLDQDGSASGVAEPAEMLQRFEQNLQYCNGTPAVFAVVQDAGNGAGHTFGPLMMQALLSRLVVLGASQSETVRILRGAGFDWVWHDQKPQRIIQLLEDTRRGEMSWHHTATCSVHFQARARGWDVAGMLAVVTQEVTAYFDGRDQLLCARPQAAKLK